MIADNLTYNAIAAVVYRIVSYRHKVCSNERRIVGYYFHDNVYVCTNETLLLLFCSVG